jgi:sugar phosphate isomerase/epimerase
LPCRLIALAPCLQSRIYYDTMLTIAARAKNINQGQTLAASKFRVLEITLPCPGGDTEFAAWSNLCNSGDVLFLAHGPEEGNPADIQGLESGYLPKLRLAMEQAVHLECGLLTIHFWLESRFLSSDVIDAKVKLLERVVNWGNDLGVRVNLENLSESYLDLNRAMEAIPTLGITLDVGHAQILSEKNTSLAIIENLFPRIRHLHLHDNLGGNSPKSDLHLPPGQGIVPFDAIFKSLFSRGYNSTGTLELEPDEAIKARDWVIEAWEKAAL